MGTPPWDRSEVVVCRAPASATSDEARFALRNECAAAS
jgi:hypothetical protein